MRRMELLINDVRRATENTDHSSTSGITDFEFEQYLNEAQERLQSRISAQHPRVFMAESFIDLVAAQEAYSLPALIYMDTRLSVVEYKFGSGSTDYVPIRPRSLADRFSYMSGDVVPSYIRRGSQILLNPIPSVAKTSGLRVSYQKSLRRLGIRIGLIDSASKTSTTLNSLTLDLAPAEARHTNLQSRAELYLADTPDSIPDYICIVDKDGTSVVDSIPITSYAASTGVLTVGSGFTTTVAAASMADQFIVAGYFSTSHSDLPDICERYLISYGCLKILRRDGNLPEADAMERELRALESDIVDSFQEPDDDISEAPLDSDWV